MSDYPCTSAPYICVYVCVYMRVYMYKDMTHASKIKGHWQECPITLVRVHHMCIHVCIHMCVYMGVYMYKYMTHAREVGIVNENI
jgi:hypothetical protein